MVGNRKRPHVGRLGVDRVGKSLGIGRDTEGVRVEAGSEAGWWRCGLAGTTQRYAINVPSPIPVGDEENLPPPREPDRARVQRLVVGNRDWPATGYAHQPDCTGRQIPEVGGAQDEIAVPGDISNPGAVGGPGWRVQLEACRNRARRACVYSFGVQGISPAIDEAPPIR